MGAGRALLFIDTRPEIIEYECLGCCVASAIATPLR